MRSAAIVLAVCLLASSAFASMVTGKVVDAAGTTVAGVGIHLLSEDARYGAVSNADGEFRVEDVKPGPYQVLLVRGASFFSQPSIRVGDRQDLAVLLKLKLRLDANATATVTGILRDSQHRPVPNARIDLIRGPGTSIPAMTGPDGRFAFEHVSPGYYKVRTMSQGTVTYFPDTDEEDKAQLLAVRDRTELEFSLQPTPVYRITGKVRDENYKPVPNVRLWLFPMVQHDEPLVDATLDSYFLIDQRPRHLGIEEASVQSDENGEFSLTVRTGMWRIQADTDKLSGGVSIRVDGNDREIEVPVTSRPITGKLQWSTLCVRGRLVCGPDTGADIVVPLRVHSSGSTSNAIAITQADGSFSAFATHEYESDFAALPPVADGRPVPGILALRNDARKGSPLALSFTIRTQGGGDVLLDQDHEVKRVVAGLGEAMSGTIRGQVVNGTAAAVILLPEDAPRYGVLIPCDPDGRYLAIGLAPGAYRSAAIRGLTVENLRAFGLLSFVRKSGTQVTVQDSTTIEKDLKLAEWPE